MSFLSAVVLLFTVMDPVGNIPMFLAVLRHVHPSRRGRIIAREMCIALVVLLLFLFLGPTVMSLLDIAEHSLSIAGGIVLFIISVRLIFYGTDEIFAKGIEGEPFLFPLAVPFIAGPSAMASIFLLMAREPQRWRMWLLALLCAWFASGVILVSAGSLSRVLGPRTLIAIERLMGMLLVLLSVNMFLDGVEQLTGCG